MLILVEVFGGLLLGTAFGWALQKGGFCMNSAFRSILFEKDKSLLRSWILVLVINIPVVAALDDFGIIHSTTTPLYWPALIIGGLMFGIGMVLAGGCASGTWYRAGRGMLGSWAALIGFLFASAAIDGGIFAGVRTALRSSVIDVRGREATLYNLTGLESGWTRWLLIALLLTPLVIYLLRAPKQKFVMGWGWKKTGFVVGILAAAAWPLSALVGRNFGMSFTQPGSALVRLFTAGDASGIGLPVFILLGVPLGAYLTAWKNGEARWTAPSPQTQFRQGMGGLVMGAGAAIAGGCNIGHGISGLSTLGIGSMLGVFSIMVGCWLMTALVIAGEKAKLQLSNA